jgi:hypothetical protein
MRLLQLYDERIWMACYFHRFMRVGMHCKGMKVTLAKRLEIDPQHDENLMMYFAPHLEMKLEKVIVLYG